MNPSLIPKSFARKGVSLFLFSVLPFAVTVHAGGNAHSAAEPSLYMKVRLDSHLKIKTLKPGDTVEGVLFQCVYLGSRQLIPVGARVRLTVDHLEKRRRPRNDHWPWMVQVFTPRHENYPVFRSASVILPDGRDLPLLVAFLSIADERQVEARRPKSAGAAVSAITNPAPATAAVPIATLEATVLNSSQLPADSVAGPAPAPSSDSNQVTLEPGTQAKVILLGAVSASKIRAGDPIEARLIEPLRVGSIVVLPERTIFEGKVVRADHPKWLSRPGSLLISFDALALQPGGSGEPLVASVSAAQLDRRSHTKIDSEGTMRGGWPGKSWMLINLGVTAGIAKVSDDTLQLIIEAIVSTATDASTAGVGRIVASSISGAFMLTRHGRDVVLPQYTELRVTLDRPLTLPGSQETHDSAIPVPAAAPRVGPNP